MLNLIGELFFSNIGEKIKKVAVFLTLLGTIISGVIGYVGYVLINDMFGEYGELAIVLAVVGVLLSWVSSFLIYGYGELIELSSDMSYILATLKEEKEETK